VRRRHRDTTALDITCVYWLDEAAAAAATAGAGAGAAGVAGVAVFVLSSFGFFDSCSASPANHTHNTHTHAVTSTLCAVTGFSAEKNGKKHTQIAP